MSRGTPVSLSGVRMEQPSVNSDLLVERKDVHGARSQRLSPAGSDTPLSNSQLTKALYVAVACLKFKSPDGASKCAGQARRGDRRRHSQLREDRTDSRALHRISRTTRALHISGVIGLTVKILAARETSALGRDDD